MSDVLIIVGASCYGFIVAALGYRSGYGQGFKRGWMTHKNQVDHAALDAILFGHALVTENPDLYRKIHDNA